MKAKDAKAKFRQTKEWKTFRIKIAEKQDKKDIITGKPLRKCYNCHHLDMSAENYDQLTEENFIAVNKTTHETIHTLFRYYKNDKDILNRIKQVLDRMNELNK